MSKDMHSPLALSWYTVLPKVGLIPITKTSTNYKRNIKNRVARSVEPHYYY